MPTAEFIPACLQSRAELVVQTFAEEFHIPLTYDSAGIDQVSEYIDLVREQLLRDHAQEAVTSLGAFVGQTLIRSCGGDWSDELGWWGVKLADGVVASPFVQVRSQLLHGAEQSVSRYYACIRTLSSQLRITPEVQDLCTDRLLIRKMEMELAIWTELERREAV